MAATNAPPRRGYVRIKGGGVGERLKPAVLKIKVAVWLSDTKFN